MIARKKKESEIPEHFVPDQEMRDEEKNNKKSSNINCMFLLKYFHYEYQIRNDMMIPGRECFSI